MHLRSVKCLNVALVLVVLAVAGCGTDASSDAVATEIVPSTSKSSMSVAFVRHAESLGNTSGLLDTSTPGPGLSPVGEQQAAELAHAVAGEGFDCVYASTMVRTQATAERVAETLNVQVEVLPGLREIEAGEFEGQPEESAIRNYLAAPMRWLHGDLDARIPGSVDGHEFDRRFDDAMSTIRDAGCIKPIVVSHGGALMVWTLMNAENADPDLLEDGLENTSRVDIEGVPHDWRLTSWKGREIG